MEGQAVGFNVEIIRRGYLRCYWHCSASAYLAEALAWLDPEIHSSSQDAAETLKAWALKRPGGGMVVD